MGRTPIILQIILNFLLKTHQMSKVELITKNIWSRLTRAAKSSKSKSIVAVAYFGTNASKMLPIKKGSILVVDGSLKALKSGQTNPDELLALYRKEVKIYSKENLHAKLFVINNVLYCGSTNVSGRSANMLSEALIMCNNCEVVDNAKKYILSFCRQELGKDEILQMKEHYRPQLNAGPRATKGYTSNEPNLYLVKLRMTEWTEDEEFEAEKGRKIATKRREIQLRHKLDEFIWKGKMNIKENDYILQVVNDGGIEYVYPIGKLLYVHKWSNGTKVINFCFVEIPEKRRRSLKSIMKQLDHKNKNSINRQGIKSTEFENMIRDIWS